MTSHRRARSPSASRCTVAGPCWSGSTSEDEGELAAQLPARSGLAWVDGVVIGAELEIDRQFVEQLDDPPDPGADWDHPLLACRGERPDIVDDRAVDPWAVDS